jgi:peptidoglycan/LPS O-acetylase OafA/YrhL
VHRIRRLAPALVATTALTLLVGWLWLLPTEFSKLAQQTIAAQLYFANIFYWQNVNYFGLRAHDVYLLHTWSLAVEEQFYIVFPMAMVGVNRLLGRARWASRDASSPWRLGLFLALGAVVSFGLNVGMVHAKPEATFYLMPTRAWELLAGALLALWVPRLRGDQARAANWAGLAGWGLMGIALTSYREDLAFPGAFALLPVASGVLLILAGSLGAGFSTRLLSVAPLTYLGKISYPLYLVHWPVNVFATAVLGPGYTLGWRAAMLVLSVLLAMLIFHGIEGSARRWLPGAPARVLWWYGASLVGAVAFSSWVWTHQGVPARFPPQVVQLAAYAQDLPPSQDHCEYRGNKALQLQSMCRLGSSAVAPTWLVYGDSHAWAASGAIDEWLKNTGQSAAFMFVHACPPVLGVYVFRQGATCYQANAAALALLRDTPSLAQVLLISTWRQAQEGLLSNRPNRLLTTNQSVELFEQQFGVTLRQLRALGKRSYVWEPLPGARANVPQAMARAELTGIPADINYSHTNYLSEFSFFFKPLAQNRELIDGVFSTSTELCASGLCMSAVAGLPLYYDNAHLAHTQRFFWADALKRQISASMTTPRATPQPNGASSAALASSP